MSYKILVVDDEAANLRILERLFRSQYTIISAASGTEALELLTQYDIALIISDQRMPEMTGIEFLKRAAEMRPQTVRIILTGYTDINALVEAINSGVVYKYVTKPWINEDLKQTVQRGLQHYETVKSQYELKMHNDRLQTRLKTTLESFVDIVAATIDSREPEGHSKRTTDYAVAIGQRLNLEENALEQLSFAARLHEFAHANLPNHILQKINALTEDEKIEEKLSEDELLIFTHSFERCLRMLERIPDLEDAVYALRYLHEHFDGNGYPAGLSDERIPLIARIIAVADAYDKMGSADQLQNAAGKKFDPEIVKILSELKSSGQLSAMSAEQKLSFSFV